ncbi:unnamed protein product [Diatraea saccharalis]|uniref:Uncharacterized protein n=1 Tax=Diatraea saccharalis TaxID=40085 RepID=A0A9N9RD28_9NEOP|nr:unnamed protein product [Diatraea saccharalis]
MLCLLTLCPVLLVAVQTLTIDSQLGTSIEVPTFRVGAKGNATCNLSNISEKELKERNLLMRHPDYDVYVRRFQCEQAPPSPLQPQFDDPGDGPVHRPVFRPDEEDRRPLDDYLSDSRPFESIRPDLIKPIPPYRPPYHNHLDNDRPDDYNSQKPVFDDPPSYGSHKPIDIPYKPQPQKPNPIESYRPDPYDELNFQGPYKPTRPLNQGYWRPNTHHNTFDTYGLEKPTYQYFVRPNRKPRPHDSEYDKFGYPTKPDPYGVSRPIYPNGPQDYRPNPSRPYDKPSYNYNSQYASNYGQSNYQDNSVYVEIYDPPRPYKPPKKPQNDKPNYGTSQGGYGQNYGYGDQGGTGYGSHTSHNSFTQSQSSHYGQGTITEIVNHNRPSNNGYGQSSPYGGTPNTGYGSQSNSYGSEKPEINKPSYQNSQGYYGSSQASYGSTSSESSYGSSHSHSSSKPSYSSLSNIGYETNTHKPNHDINYGSFDGNQGYGSQGNYVSKPSYTGYAEQHNSQSYGVSQGSYEVNRPIYNNNKPDYNRPDKPLYDSYRPIYENHRPSYSIDKPTYGNRPYDDDRPSYGNERPSYGNKPINDKPAYGSDRPFGNKPSYENDSPSYGNNKPSYGNDRPSYGGKPVKDKPAYDHRPSYGSKPVNDKPAYDNRPSYGNKPVNDKPAYDNRPSYGNKPVNDKPAYDDTPSYGNEPVNNKPTYDDRPSYGGKPVNNKPINNDRPSYGNDGPSYDINRPDPPSYNRPSDIESSGYGSQNNESPNDYKQHKPNYGSPNQTDYNRPDVKPVFEYEFEKPNNVPSYIVRPGGEVVTSRPVSVGDYGGRPPYGRDPGHGVSFKGK